MKGDRIMKQLTGNQIKVNKTSLSISREYQEKYFPTCEVFTCSYVRKNNELILRENPFGKGRNDYTIWRDELSDRQPHIKAFRGMKRHLGIPMKIEGFGLIKQESKYPTIYHILLPEPRSNKPMISSEVRSITTESIIENIHDSGIRKVAQLKQDIIKGRSGNRLIPYTGIMKPRKTATRGNNVSISRTSFIISEEFFKEKIDDKNGYFIDYKDNYLYLDPASGECGYRFRFNDKSNTSARLSVWPKTIEFFNIPIDKIIPKKGVISKIEESDLPGGYKIYLGNIGTEIAKE